MAVPSSGELKLWDSIWNQEIGGTQGENSLHSASIYAGFSIPDAMGDFYGWSDIIAPSVTTDAISSVTYNTLTLNGNVTATGGEDVSRGWYFGTTANPYSSNDKTTLSGTQGTGTFSQGKSVSASTTYYAWAWASNSAGETVGSRVQAATPAAPFVPSMANMQVHNSGGNNASQIYYNGFNGVAVTNANGPAGARYSGGFVQCATNTTNRSQAGGDGCSLNIVAAPGFFNSRSITISTPSHVSIRNNNQNQIRASMTNPSISDERLFFQYGFSSDIRLKTNISYL